MLGTRTNHFPFSDHDIIITKLKTEGINRGPGMWIMNLERSVEKSFDILSKYEKASGSTINYIKTKAISIGNARHRKPKFYKISGIKENVKTLGVHHGYNVDNDKIWKDIIDRMKNCISLEKQKTFLQR